MSTTDLTHRAAPLEMTPEEFRIDGILALRACVVDFRPDRLGNGG